MADDKKWAFLAEIAQLQTEWTQIVDDIIKAVNSVHIIPVEDSVKKTESNLQDSFDLQRILDLNQLNIKQAT